LPPAQYNQQYGSVAGSSHPLGQPMTGPIVDVRGPSGHMQRGVDVRGAEVRGVDPLNHGIGGVGGVESYDPNIIHAMSQQSRQSFPSNPAGPRTTQTLSSSSSGNPLDVPQHPSFGGMRQDLYPSPSSHGQHNGHGLASAAVGSVATGVNHLGSVVGGLGVMNGSAGDLRSIGGAVGGHTSVASLGHHTQSLQDMRMLIRPRQGHESQGFSEYYQQQPTAMLGGSSSKLGGTSSVSRSGSQGVATSIAAAAHAAMGSSSSIGAGSASASSSIDGDLRRSGSGVNGDGGGGEYHRPATTVVPEPMNGQSGDKAPHSASRTDDGDACEPQTSKDLDRTDRADGERSGDK